ncbi:DNA polymerase III, delta subunit [Bacteriovorax sp. Seq25_V]|uniref:DNA polymerase III, delta subunit n=1 Tax=Bacteriovorax sp. Seq25_V TaxID=1201288 RepID=UPI00038A3448|nr:DNA polymerase III, delta subunit [Bacteriovorax sp. Seq25_V]EQC44321.1 DNA polymerase III, delta subunit [Bacteriovorax sp. Seq25_V]
MASELQKLKEILVAKYKNGTMAHFYTLTMICNLDEGLEWINEFLRSITEKKSPREHQDILFIETDEKNYTLKNNEFRDFFSFLGTRPIELTRKIIVIKDAHKISDTIANKLLKTLEEPEVEASIFLINSERQQIMPTITSRAINLTLSSEGELLDFTRFKSVFDYLSSKDDFTARAIASFIQTRSTVELTQAVKDSNFNENEFIKLMTQITTHFSENKAKIPTIINDLKDFEQQREFNNSLAHRVTSLANKIL